jgi:hypothetical protein
MTNKGSKKRKRKKAIKNNTNENGASSQNQYIKRFMH